MEARDLMIDDWVYNRNDKSKKPFQIKKVCTKTIMDLSGRYLNYINVKPVPLTPEILEKNGFYLKDYDSSSFMSGKWWTREDFVFPQNMNDSVGRNNFKYDYVHKLQHALRLCGIKKEIII